MLNPIFSLRSTILCSLLALTLFSACSPGNGLRNSVFCGNNHVQESEECDDGANNGNTAQCTSACKINVCGDGLVLDGRELCDDGVLNSNSAPNACRRDCTWARCGDGVVDSGETCDDGNTDNLDGCTNACTRPECGNGRVEAGEGCDDGNSLNTDGCLTTCVKAACGDGIVWTGQEGCDDGARNSNTFPNACRVDCAEARCGDGVTDRDEACDDGNDSNEDGCLNICALAVCGDGFIGENEECDDGNDSNEDGCLNSCALAACGDGFVEAGVEGCDEEADNGRGVGYCKDDCGGVEPLVSMVRVPAGDFIYDEDQTLTTDAFLIDIHEVTAGDYKACVEAKWCSYGATGAERFYSDYHTYNNGKDDHPINFVNWQEAVAYCAWKGKRLPTEVEWEKAARGTDGRTYPWGNQSPASYYAVMDDGGDGCGTNSTWEVGQKPNGISPYGVLDMAGNVLEWTDSWAATWESSRVLRGGSFVSTEFSLGSSKRSSRSPAKRHLTIGFRCAQ